MTNLKPYKNHCNKKIEQPVKKQTKIKMKQVIKISEEKKRKI